MAYHIEKEEGGVQALVFDGWEEGVATSPHKGVANLLGVDISTEPGEVMVSYRRAQSSQTPLLSGTLTFSGTDTLNSGDPRLLSGSWITVSGSSIGGLSNGNYYVITANSTLIQLSTTFSQSAASVISGYSAGSATWTALDDMDAPVASAIETYHNSSGVQYRYYVLDASGRVWVHDSATLTGGISTPNWFLPNLQAVGTYYSGQTSAANGGIAVLNGIVLIFVGGKIFGKPSVRLSDNWAQFSAGALMSLKNSVNPHFAYVGHQGAAYYTDGNYLGSIFPNSSLGTSVSIPNIQSFCSFTAVTTTGTITTVLSGSIPATATGGSTNRIPAFFFVGVGGTQPTNLSAGTKYYIDYTPGLSAAGTFEVYSTATGGMAIDIAAGAAGTQYFNTFYPFSSDGNTVMTFTPQRLNLPTFEIATSITELGNQVIIGTQSNILYPWNQVDPTPGDVIPLPENNVAWLLTVNNVAYVFAGNKGNIYITNGSSVSLALTFPDYVTGLVEPYYIWGGVMYLRGRVWFSIQDQTASHTGQAGGIWSFVPSQNYWPGQDTGYSLRMDNYSLNGNSPSLNGRSALLIPDQNQQARGPQYWNVNISSVTSPSYIIYSSDTTTSTKAVIQTELVPVGTLLNKKSFSQIEYKLATPMVAGESVALYYRFNLTDSFTALPTLTAEAATDLSGYYTVDFQSVQWIQLQAILTPATSSSSFVRLSQIRAR